MGSFTEQEEKRYIERIKEFDTLKGKTISNIEVQSDWRRTDIENMTIHFSDGTSIYLYSVDGASCSECDPDGANGSVLNFEISKRKVPK